MGGALQVCTPYRDRTALVRLHAYDFTSRPEANAAGSADAAAPASASCTYRLGVEVHDCEWSYGGAESSTGGIFGYQPVECEVYAHGPVERMGRTELSRCQVEALIAELSKSWPASEYSAFSKHSGHFCSELCVRLGVGPVPDWAMTFACKNASAGEHLQRAAADVRGFASTVAARTCEVDVQGHLRNSAHNLKAKFGQVDQQLGLTAAAADAAARAGELDARLGLTAAAADAAARAGELDARLGLTAAATGAAARAQDIAQGITQQAVSGARNTLRTGKEARGADDADGYQFGDFTRGLLQGVVGPHGGPPPSPGPGPAAAPLGAV